MTDTGCKVCRVLADRDMAEYEQRMVEHWHGQNGQRMGYRQLADWFNVTLLRREMDKAGVSTLGDEAESKYDRLQKGGTVAEEVRTVLKRNGVPIEQVESDFVSYGVVRTHLTECLGEEYEEESGDWEGDAIGRARNHAEQKISEAVAAAVSNGKLDAVGDVSVELSVDLTCSETHVSVPVDQALRRGYVSKLEAGDPDGHGEPRHASQPTGDPE
jgi:hypothetical protein